MTCHETEMLLPELIDGSLYAELEKQIKQHLSVCKDCATAHRQTVLLLSEMVAADTNQIPKESLKKTFYLDTLPLLQNSLPTTGSPYKSIKMFSFKNIAAAAFFTAVGLAAGLFLRPANQAPITVSSLRSELPEGKKMTSLAMLKNESAIERLKAVEYVEDMGEPSPAVIQALVTVLNSDNNLHVRVAAASLLENYADRRDVLDALVTSLRTQQEPMVQIIIMHILTEKKEHRARQPIRDILRNVGSDVEVKKIAKKSLAEL